MGQSEQVKKAFEGNRGILELAACDFLQALKDEDLEKARYELQTLAQGHTDIENEIENLG